jgi:subtilisin family serine protease/subtilisin-like proprotein convertase family protein
VSLSTVGGEKWAIEFHGNGDVAAQAAQTFSALTGMTFAGRVGDLRAFEFIVPDNLDIVRQTMLNVTRTALKAIEAGNAFAMPTHPIPQLQELYASTHHMDHIAERIPWASEIESLVRQHGIRWVEEIKSKAVEKRSSLVAISDPLFGAQYHLHERVGNLATLNAVGAWDQGYTGAGVLIAVVDDGLQHSHPDITANYRADGSYNFDYNKPDPSPTNMVSDYHGTSSAGVAAARDDGSACGVGVAYRAGLSGVAILQRNALDDSKDARALQYKLDLNHIYSNSWGPTDGGVGYDGPGPLTRQALDLGIHSGRNGLGAIYVWAAGNGGSADNCNYDGYASMRTVLTIGAVDYLGVKSSFSEECAALLVVAPSASNERSYIRTTDLLGKNGRAQGDCNLAFSGTSAACPAVAGVVALILEANPSLGWLDVQRVLVETAHRNDPSSPTWSQNAAGFWISHYYGFGLADANAAVTRALALRQMPNMEETVISYRDSTGYIWSPQPTYSKYGVIFEIPVDESATIHHVELVTQSITTPDAGKLDVTLYSPSNTPSTLAKSHRTNHANLRNWVFTSRRLWGEQSSGTWKVVLLDSSATGSISAYSLRIWVTPNLQVTQAVYKQKENDTWVVTDAPNPTSPIAPVPIPSPPRPSPTTPTPTTAPSTIPPPSSTAPPTGLLIPSGNAKEIGIIIGCTILGLVVTSALIFGIYYYWKHSSGNNGYDTLGGVSQLNINEGLQDEPEASEEEDDGLLHHTDLENEIGLEEDD